MGFFKNIGKSIKKVTKQISFKNVVKLGAMAVPGIGGSIIGNLQAQHEQKKADAQAQADANRAQAEYNAVQTKLALDSSLLTNTANGTTSNPNIGQILIGAAGGALAGAGGVLAPSQTTGQIGASAVDSTISEWFKKHIMHIGIGVSVIVAFFIFRGSGGSRRKKW